MAVCAVTWRPVQRGSARDVLRAGVVIVLSAAGFLALDWRLALAFLVVFPIHGLSLRVYLPRAARLYAEERRLAAERGRVVLE